MRGHRAVIAASLAAVTMATYQSVQAGAHALTPARQNATTAAQAARDAVGYLQSQLLGDGGLPSEFSTGSDPASTFDMIQGASAAGIDPATLSNGGSSAVDYMSAETADSAVLGSAGKLGMLILAVVADRHDPATFGSNNLITAMNALYTSRTGVYGDGQTASQSYAILGLVAAGSTVPPAAITYLEGLRDSDGGWNYTDRSDAAAGSDTNSTAVALMALDAAGHHEDDAAAVTWLQGQQDSDAGFPYQAGWGSDVDSTALVIQALVATGADPSTWTRSGVSPLAFEMAQQDAGGGFGYQGAAPDPFTTSEVPPGLLGEPFPLTPAFSAGVGAPTPAPTVTPTAAPSVTPTATPAPSATPAPTVTAAPTALPTPTGSLGSAVSWVSTGTPTPRPVVRHVATGPVPTPAATPVPPTPTGGVEAVTTTPGASPGTLPAAVAAATPETPAPAPAWIVYLLATAAGLLLVAGGGLAVRRLRS